MSQFSQLNFKHGTGKLQASTSSMLSLTSQDGGNVLVKSAIDGSYIPVDLNPAGLNQECFNNTAYVSGIPNQSLSSNTLYSVYLRNLDGNTTPNPASNIFDFYPTLSNGQPGSIDMNGLYLGPNTTSQYMYLGQVYTGNNDLSPIIGSAADMRQNVFSHIGQVWTLGYQTTNVCNNSFTMANNGIQSSPSIFTVTEGVCECPEFTGTINFLSTSTPPANTYIAFCLQITGQGIDHMGGGGSYSVQSPLQYLTIRNAFEWQQGIVKWKSAPSIGTCKARLYIMLNSSANITLWMNMNILGNITL